MTGRPGCRTMEMNGGSSEPHLARTPCVPLFCTLFNRGGNRSGDHVHCSLEASPGHIRCRYNYSEIILFEKFQRAPNPPEFAQPSLSRVKRRSSPARGYKFGCVCSNMAGHEDAGVMTGHIGTNTPKFVPPRWGRPPFDPTQTGLCKFGWVWSSVKFFSKVSHNKLQKAILAFELASERPVTSRGASGGSSSYDSAGAKRATLSHCCI